MERCGGCGKPITGPYVEVLGKLWHPEHFVCTVCKCPFPNKKFLVKDGEPYCEKDYHQRFSPRCAGCRQPIIGSYVSAMGRSWHPEHFLCANCQKPTGQKFLVKDGKPYCEEDYHLLFSPKCQVCGNVIKGPHLQNHWGERFCKWHKGKLPECFSCGRLISDRLTGGGARYTDGRTICGLCRSRAVDKESRGIPLLISVRKTLGELDLDPSQRDIPFRLTDRNELMRLARKGRKEKQVNGMARIRETSRKGVELTRTIDEILALYGLPEEHLGAVLAHELGHAYLFLNHFPLLKPKVEEGVAELFAYLWLKKRGGVDAENRIFLMEKNTDAVYGRGFKDARKAFKKHGLKKLLDHVKRTKRFTR